MKDMKELIAIISKCVNVSSGICYTLSASMNHIHYFLKVHAIL